LRQSLDTVGAFAGPLLAIALMMLFAGDFRLVFWLATVPAALAVLVILIAVREPSDTPGKARPKRLSWSDARCFPTAYWSVVAIAGLMTLARFSEAFLLLRAQTVGLEAVLVPAVFIVMNVVYAGSSYPVGRLSDRLGRRGLLLAGFAVLIVADLVLAAAGTLWQVMAGVALWGLHMGMTQGLLAALVADTAPAALRGTAYGVFNLISGIALLAASVIAGALWTVLGPAATFLAGALFTAAALLALAVWDRRTV